jgi:membrane associated rhomboid family serine protease
MCATAPSCCPQLVQYKKSDRIWTIPLASISVSLTNLKAKLRSIGSKAREGRFHLGGIKVSPGVILSIAIILGFVIALIGDTIQVCPSQLRPLSFCGNSGIDHATFLLAQYNFLVVNYHAYWQLFSSIFVTDSLLDIGFNVIAVLILDRLMGDSFSLSVYSMIFLLTALLGNLFTLVLGGPNYLSAGASGGIFGLYAASFAFVWAQDRKVDMVMAGVFIVIFALSSFGLPNVDWYAHLGGSAGGLIAGPILYYAAKDTTSNFESLRSKTLTRVTVGLAIGLIVALSAAQFLLFIST